MNTTKRISPDQFGNALADVLFKFNKTSLKHADRVSREAAINMLGSVIEETPVGDFDPATMGALKTNWVVTVGSPNTGIVPSRMPDRTRKDIAQLIPKDIMSKKRNVFMTNNMPYINVVEYGGYPMNPKLGTFNKVTGKFEIRSSKGFSKQAPKGMVRRNVNKWKRFVEIAANKIL